MIVVEDYDLTALNTLKVSARARFFTEIRSEADVAELFTLPEFRDSKKFFLGGGSNVLFTQDFDGMVIKVSIRGRKIIGENEEAVILEVGAGENWHELVTYAVENNWGGLENLAYIPGAVGAAPIQNIAAYGGNFSDVFDSLEACNVETGAIEKFDTSRCQFGYRSSIFKKELKGRYIIQRVRIRLSKNPRLETSYYQIGIVRDSIREELEKITKAPYTVKDVYQAVVNIRKRKLPDPDIVPTAGSFFLNSIVKRGKYEELKNKVSELQCYPPDQTYYKNMDEAGLQKGSLVKIATGRLLQELGWLGRWIGNVGVHDRHALVIVTNGKANGKEVADFAALMQKSYVDSYGIKLEPEVNFV